MFRADSSDSSLCLSDHASQQDVGDSDQDSQQDAGESDHDSQQEVDEGDHDDKQEAENNDHNKTTSSEKLRNLLQDPVEEESLYHDQAVEEQVCEQNEESEQDPEWI